MKQGKKLTYDQKKVLSKKNINPDEWMMVKATSTEYQLVHKETKEILIVEV